jgi:riboflavin biosynthesis pyrimidine reductase
VSASAREPDPAASLRRLLPTGEAATAEEIVANLDVGFSPEDVRGRPRVVLNMISSADGRASIAGHTKDLAGQADRELFLGLRSIVDAVLVGAGTARDERYRRMIRDPERRRLRQERGLAAEPLACLASARLALSSELPLLAEPEAQVVILTPSQREIGPTSAQVQYIRAERGGQLDLAAGLAELHDRFEVRTLLCEGGPHLSASLLADGLVDELFLTVAPKLAGGMEVLTIVAGEALAPPLEMELVWTLQSESYLFLRYRVRWRD